MKKISTLAPIALIALLFAGITAISSCKDEKDNIPANEVWIDSDSFDPSTITVAAGTTVIWRNKDSEAHTVTADNNSFFDSGNINAGASYSREFVTAGTYPYHCTYHPNMQGTVVVQ